MKIEYRQVSELMKNFTGYFPNHIHIKFLWTKTRAQVTAEETAVIPIIKVTINDTNKGGEGEEYWTLEYAYSLLKQPKEMELCVARWFKGFKNARRTPTLELPGYEKPTKH